MVLPASTPFAGQPEADWLGRLHRALTFGRGKRLVVAIGGDEALGPVVRLLWSLGPATVALSLSEVAVAPRGGTVLYRIEAKELGAANRARPLFSERAFTAVLLVPREIADDARRQAADLLDWASETVEAPIEPPAFARATWAAARQRTPGCHLTFQHVPPGMSPLSATLPYPEQVQALRGRAVAAVTGIDTRDEALRLRLAMAEARRKGGVMSWGACPVPGWPTVTDRLADGSLRAALSEAAGANAGALLAALDCEAAAVRLALELLAAGHDAGALLAAAQSGRDGGAALGTLRLEGDPAAFHAAVCGLAEGPVLRAAWAHRGWNARRGDTLRSIGRRLRRGDAVSESEAAAWAQWTRVSIHTPGLVDAILLGRAVAAGLEGRTAVDWAFDLGWYDVSAHWAARAAEGCSAPHERARLLVLQARAHVRQGDRDAARQALDAADALAGEWLRTEDSERALTFLVWGGMWILHSARSEAETALRAGLAALDTPPAHKDVLRVELLGALGVVLSEAGRREEADAALGEACALADRAYGRAHGRRLLWASAWAQHRTATGHAAESEPRLRTAIAEADPNIANLPEVMLPALLAWGDALMRLRRYVEVDTLLERAAALLEKPSAVPGSRVPYVNWLRRMEAELRLARGRPADALALAEAALAPTDAEPESAWPIGEWPRQLRVRALVAQGRYEDAVAAGRDALLRIRRASGTDSIDSGREALHLAQVLALSGRAGEAGSMAQDALRALRTALGAEHPETRQAEGLVAQLRRLTPADIPSR